jgi:hypothetical protein
MMWAMMFALCVPADGAKDKPDAEIAQLQGQWVVVLREDNGKVTPANPNEWTTLTFSGERLRWAHGTPGTIGYSDCTVRIAPAGGALGIDLTCTDENARGRRMLGSIVSRGTA